MDKPLAILLLVIVVAIIVVCEIYLRMDKNRSMALVMLKGMSAHMDKWLSVSDSLFEHSSSCPEYSEYVALVSDFHAVDKKHNAEKVTAINKIHATIKSVISENCSDLEVTTTGHELSEIFLEFSNQQMEYNRCVIKLNNSLDSKFSGTVGRIFRLNSMEKLRDLSVL